jgi:putative RNA 2'-phosphotransferase
MNKSLIKTSKFLSLVLRHQPERAGITLDGAGWVRVDTLLHGCAKHGHVVSREELEEVIRENDKKRFVLNEDGTRIRAAQGHSINIELGYAPIEPPEILYHGTAIQYLTSIKEQGLISKARQHVHLSDLVDTAIKVGGRHGRAVVIPVKSGVMHRDGGIFYLTPNAVWLSGPISPEYLDFYQLIYP